MILDLLWLCAVPIGSDNDEVGAVSVDMLQVWKQLIATYGWTDLALDNTSLPSIRPHMVHCYYQSWGSQVQRGMRGWQTLNLCLETKQYPFLQLEDKKLSGQMNHPIRKWDKQIFWWLSHMSLTTDLWRQFFKENLFIQVNKSSKVWPKFTFRQTGATSEYSAKFHGM